MSKMSVAAMAAIVLLAAFEASGEPAAPTPGPYSPGIAEIMIVTQIRHAKLWLAGDARNWALADYEIDEIKEDSRTWSSTFPSTKTCRSAR